MGGRGGEVVVERDVATEPDTVGRGVGVKVVDGTDADGLPGEDGDGDGRWERAEKAGQAVAMRDCNQIGRARGEGRAGG